MSNTPNFKTEKAGDFILIFVICLINLRKHFSVVPLYALFVSMYLSRRKKLSPLPNVLSLSSEHGGPSVPCIFGALSDVFFFFFTLLNTSLYLEYPFPLELQ